MSVEWIHGPIVSSGDLDNHVALFAAFGLVELGRIARNADETAALWGVTGRQCIEVTMQTPGVRFGTRLVAFDPPGKTIIRNPERGRDTEALKVIDFYVPDLEAARDHIEAAGFRFKPEIADYDTPRGRFREAHLWGPDGVVCALLHTDPAQFRGATLIDRIVSEPQSISGPVRDPEPTLAFLQEVLGLQILSTYGIAQDPSFQALTGAASLGNLRAWNVGLTPAEPYLGVIDYGLTDNSQQSLKPLAGPPSRGLVGATLIVRDLAAICAAAGEYRVTAPVRAEVPGFGMVTCAGLLGPNGCWFALLEP